MDFPSWLLPTILLVLLPCMFICINRRKRSSASPPGPRGLPVLGNLHQLTGDIHQTLWKLSQKYGPNMLLHFGSQPVLVISSAEMAGQVLKTHDQKMCTRPHSKASKLLSFNYADVAFSPYNDHWRSMRKFLVSEFLGGNRTRLYKNVMEVEMEGVLRSLSSPSLVNLDDLFLNLVNDVVCKVTFGNSYKDKTFDGTTLKEIVEETLVMLSTSSLSDTFPIFGWILDELKGWNRRLHKCYTHLDGFLQMILDDHHLEPGHREKDFVDDCISRLTKDEIKALLMNVLEGALDTSSTTMVWAMSEIVKNPRIMKKLQEEIRNCVGRKPSVHESDITNMTYLKMVVKETLRLHPPVVILMGRECVSHCQIGGYDVLPGTTVIVNVWGIARDPKFWKESPNEFYPERFENIQVDFGGKNFEMIPFGGGRRACPGYNSAISTIEFTIANLLYLFNWEMPGEVKNQDLNMEEHGYPFIRRKTPLCLVPIKHNFQD